MTKKGPLDQSIYYDAVSAYHIKQLQIMRVDEAKLNSENPRRVMSQDKLFIQQLLDLLQQLCDHEKVAREIISLLEEIPVNLEMQGQLVQSAQAMGRDGDNFEQWSKIFQWNYQEREEAKGVAAGEAVTAR